MSSVADKFSSDTLKRKRAFVSRQADAIEKGAEIDTEQLRLDALAAGIDVGQVPVLMRKLQDRFEAVTAFEAANFDAQFEVAKAERGEAIAANEAATELLDTAREEARAAGQRYERSVRAINAVAERQKAAEREHAEFMRSTGHPTDWRNIAI